MEYSSERPTDMSQERLIQELEDTKEQLKKQKTLKEMYINRGKETTRELERLRKYSDDVYPYTNLILSIRYETDVTEVRQQVETLQHEPQKEAQQRKLLQQQPKELKMAQTSSQDKFTAELQVEQQKNKLLQDKLDRISEEYESEEDDRGNQESPAKHPGEGGTL